MEKNLNIFQELYEARFYRYVDTLDGKKLSSLAEVWYMFLLLLELSRKYDNSYAKKYSLQTINYGDFDGIRTYATDFYNITSILNNLSRFEKRIVMDTTVSVPILGFKRYLRDIMFENDRPAMDRTFFMSCESFMSIKDSRFRAIRRIILDLDIAHKEEIVLAGNTINIRLANQANNADLHYYYKEKLRNVLEDI